MGLRVTRDGAVLLTVYSFDICWTIAVLRISTVFTLTSIAFSCAGDSRAAVGSFPARFTTAECFPVYHVTLAAVVAAGHPAWVIIAAVVTVEASFAIAASVYAISAILTDMIATTFLNGAG